MRRHKEAFYVPLDSYLPAGEGTDAVPIFDDIPIIARLFRPPMPESLKNAGALFGWDDKQLENVAAALAKFARELAAAEQNGTRIDYPNGGGVRFDFSACQPAREAVVAQFKQALEQAIGTRDAERFGLLSKLEDLAAPLPDHYEITASYEGEFVVVRAPGVLEIHAAHEAGAPVDFSSFAGRSLDARVRHLGLEVDWSGLDPNAEPGHPSTQMKRVVGLCFVMGLTAGWWVPAIPWLDTAAKMSRSNEANASRPVASGTARPAAVRSVEDRVEISRERLLGLLKTKQPTAQSAELFFTRKEANITSAIAQ